MCVFVCVERVSVREPELGLGLGLKATAPAAGVQNAGTREA